MKNFVSEDHLILGWYVCLLVSKCSYLKKGIHAANNYIWRTFECC